MPHRLTSRSWRLRHRHACSIPCGIVGVLDHGAICIFHSDEPIEFIVSIGSGLQLRRVNSDEIVITVILSTVPSSISRNDPNASFCGFKTRGNGSVEGLHIPC
jgi:hypothetical protein